MPVIEIPGQADLGGSGSRTKKVDRFLSGARLETRRRIRDGSDGIHVSSWNCRWGRQVENGIANPMPIPTLWVEKGV